jgi:predicted transcriptional regulator
MYLRVDPEVKARLQREADESGRKLQAVADDAFQMYIKYLDRKIKKPS